MPLIIEIEFFLRYQIKNLEHYSTIVESRVIVFITFENRIADQIQGHADDRCTREQLYLTLNISYIRQQ